MFTKICISVFMMYILDNQSNPVNNKKNPIPKWDRVYPRLLLSYLGSDDSN